VLAPFNNRRAGRRIFWSGFLVASVSAFFVVYPPDWKSGIVLSLLAAFLMLVTAYFSSPYIKIRGKIYAFGVQDSLADPSTDSAPPPGSDDAGYDPTPDSYSGLATAKKSWWLMIFAMGICAFTVDPTKPWHTALSVVVIVAVAAMFGYGDASWGYSIARGQRIQFGIIALITAGVFTVLYLGAYYAGKRWPIRRKQSLEYRAHPRHQKRYP
jgi:hypothetical protein